MDEKELDKRINEAAHIPLPEGLKERLSGSISQWEAAEKRKGRQRLLSWSIGIAAAVALTLALLLPKNRPADTFSDPREAALAAKQTLNYLAKEMDKGFAEVNRAGLSRQMDKGFAEVEAAKRPIRQANRILYKHLKK
ncbi:MAG: hypothetical protein LBL81_03205 [Tannerella sp.]|jgi:hypothetical protein|nr:hypothetical protein [Tannerella sp.]